MKWPRNEDSFNYGGPSGSKYERLAGYVLLAMGLALWVGTIAALISGRIAAAMVMTGLVAVGSAGFVVYVIKRNR
jgi:hypothetical protein